jgi:hypothetical protein
VSASTGPASANGTGSTGEASSSSGALSSGSSGASSDGSGSGRAGVTPETDPPGAGAGGDGGTPLEAFKSELSNGAGNVAKGFRGFFWDVVAVPYDFVMGTEHSNYAQASGEALRGGAFVLSVTWDVYLNLETAGLKGLGDFANDWYQTGDPIRFQEYSGGFLAGTLTAKAGEVVAESGIGERAPKRGTAAPQADSPQGGKPVTPGGETPVPDSPVPSSLEGGPAPNAVSYPTSRTNARRAC